MTSARDSSGAAAPPADGTAPRSPSMQRFLVGGMVWAGLGLGAAVALAFVVNALAARLLSEADLGAFLVMLSMAQTASVVVELGQPGLIAKEIAGDLADDDAARGAFVSRALTLVVVAGTVLCLGTAVAGSAVSRALYSEPAVTAVFPLLGLAVLPRAFERTLGDVYRGLADIRAATVFGTAWVQAAGAAALGALLVVTDQTSAGTALVAYAAAGMTVLPVALWSLRRRLPLQRNREGYAHHLSEGWPLIGHRLFSTLLQQAPLWMVTGAIGASDAASFGLALRVVTMIAVPMTVANQVVPPIVARLFRESKLAEMERAIRPTATAATAVAVALVFVFAVAGEPLVRTAFGAQYATDAARLLLILSIGQLGAVWSGPCAIVLLQAGHQRMLFRIIVVVLAIEIVAIRIALEFGGASLVAAIAGICLAAQNAAIVVANHSIVGVRTDASVVTTWRVLRSWRAGRQRRKA